MSFLIIQYLFVAFSDVLDCMMSCLLKIYQLQFIEIIVECRRIGIDHSIVSLIDLVTVQDPPPGHGVVVLRDFISVVFSRS